MVDSASIGGPISLVRVCAWGADRRAELLFWAATGCCGPIIVPNVVGHDYSAVVSVPAIVLRVFFQSGRGSALRVANNSAP